MQSSLFLIQDKQILKDTMSLNAEYLFQNDKVYDADTYDLGDKTIQCGRKIESLKNWLRLAANGERELERLVDKLFETRDYLVDLIKKRSNFRLVLDKFEGNTVCFWYLPASLMKIGWENIKPEQLHQVCPKMKAKMLEEGTIMVSYQPITCKKLPNFFRMVLTCQPEVEKSSMDFLINELDRMGNEIFA